MRLPKKKAMQKYLVVILFLVLSGCKLKNQNGPEKTFDKFNNVTKVDKINEIKTDILSKPLVFYIVDSLLIAYDMYNPVKGIHIFNKNNFNYIATAGIIGDGPGEIGRPGPIFIDYKHHCLLVGDWGKMVMWKFQLDSACKIKDYKPSTKIPFPKNGPLLEGAFINDSILISSSFSINSNKEPILSLVKVDTKSQTIKKFGYTNPKLNKLSMKQCSFNFGLTDDGENYILAYKNIDLVTICTKSGELKCNIYGPVGLDMKNNDLTTYYQINTFGKYIIISYVGDKGSKLNSSMRKEMVMPNKLIVFDIDGNYIKTIDTVVGFFSYTYDKENKRIIAYFPERESPLGYFNLNL